jgi:nitrogen fixation protein FixH
VTQSSVHPVETRSGNWIPWTFVAGFALVIAVNGALIWFAVESFSGLTDAHAYQAGLAYNQTLAEAHAQDALGWNADLAVERTPEPDEARVTFTLIDRNGHPIEAESVAADFLRPVAAGKDRSAVLAAKGGGRYSATVPLGLAGQWDVRVVARHDGQVWQMTRRIQVP